jgi:peroxiredoxin
MPTSTLSMPESQRKLAPELSVSAWLNADKPLSLRELRGQVVMLHAFQMLCPGCVLHSLPQAKELSQVFRGEDLQIIGLHSVFENHQVMTPAALEVFAAEFRLPFPIAIDRCPDGRSLPETMEAYGMHGTPTAILIDRQGRISKHHFGQVSDFVIAGQIGALLAS